MTEAEKREERLLYQVKGNGCFQFGVLLKRCFLCIVRNKVASQLRILAYIFFSVLLTMMYYDIGNKATRVMNNAALFVVTLAIILFQSIMPTVLICEYNLTSYGCGGREIITRLSVAY